MERFRSKFVCQQFDRRGAGHGFTGHRWFQVGHCEFEGVEASSVTENGRAAARMFVLPHASCPRLQFEIGMCSGSPLTGTASLYVHIAFATSTKHYPCVRVIQLD